MAFFTLACAFHDTSRLLEQILPLAIRSLTVPTVHDFEVVLVADRSTDDVAARLLPRLAALGVDELRFRRTRRHAFSGAPSNNFHANHFITGSPYLITFTDDTFIYKADPAFDVLDATAALFERHAQLAVISKVDDHDEWDRPLVDVAPPLEPGIRSVNRAVDQLLAYDTARFAPLARRFGAFQRDTFGSRDGHEYQWENMLSHACTASGHAIAYPESWPLRVRHADLRIEPGSMHGTGNEDVKLACFARLLETAGLAKR